MLRSYTLADKYDLTKTELMLTGIQALVRLPIMQRALDQRDGLNTAGFISGYRGSPLGAFDFELWRQQKLLESHDVYFEPGVNEDLAATAIWGTQLLDYYRQDATRDGVFGIWYGKSHGVDRTGDAFRQANIQGTSKHGGVLVLAGDDHSAESSMFAHETDQIFEATIMPVLFPSSVEEYLSLGLAGIALSRYCGLWVGFKTITDTVESGATITVPELPHFVNPVTDQPAHGFNYDVNLKWPSERQLYENRMIEERAPAAHAFVYANKIDREIVRSSHRRFGIVSAGKAHADLLEAFRTLGISNQMLMDNGISLYKVGMTWPLEPRGIREFAEGLESILVVEEKRPQLEKQIKEQLYNWPNEIRPAIYGKLGPSGEQLLPEVYVFTPKQVISALANWLSNESLGEYISKRVQQENSRPIEIKPSAVREPFFCSGCPHNTSTKLPEDSIAGAGIGCHVMALGKGLKTETVTHMGGEGVQWVGLHRFSKRTHMFQNLGDGTYQHSGILAIRQSVVSRSNITYKILFNDAVAMTGGQPTEGAPTPKMIAQQVLAEGVQEVVIVSDDPDRYDRQEFSAIDVAVYDRKHLPEVQTRLREVAGVTVLIYEQTCAAEKRRRRKRGLLEVPNRRLFINDRVCEGCGDCSVQSNCISIEPKETFYGTKRQVAQSTCNMDYSCANGFCPSFVSVVNGSLKSKVLSDVGLLESKLFEQLSPPQVVDLDGVYSILVAGIGGTGVLTIGAILSTAAHLEHSNATSLAFTGLSQKNGAVVTHVKLAPKNIPIVNSRIADGGADLLLGCDVVAATANAQRASVDKTRCVVNTAEVQTAQFTLDNTKIISAVKLTDELADVFRPESLSRVDATAICEKLFGEAIAANLFLVGYAYQLGLIPISEDAILEAVSMNGIDVAMNQRAFRWGRVACTQPDAIGDIVRSTREPVDQSDSTVDEIVQRYVGELIHYQSKAYAQAYEEKIARVRERFGDSSLLNDYASNLYRLMAYKDEYEVARLYSSAEFRAQLDDQFEGDFKLKYHLAPPLLSRMGPNGRPEKIEFGSWIQYAFTALAKLKFLRGTVLDPFGYSSERKTERALISEYEELIETLIARFEEFSPDQRQTIVRLPETVKGYGPVKEKNIARFRQAAEIAFASQESIREVAA